MRTRSTAVAFLLIFGACTADVAGDAATHEITLQSVVTLTGVGDSIDLGTGTPAVTTSGLYVAPLDDPPSGTVGIFDATGRFVRRVGASGGGPGEFRNVQSLGIGPGDSLWVIDQLYRGHLFGPPPTSAFVRTVTFERANTGRVTPFGILSGGVYTTRGAVPAHLVDWDGVLVREYGATAPTPDLHDRLGAPALRDSAHAWVPYANVYVLELLGADGSVHQRLERRVPWFPTDSATPDSRWPRRPRIHAVQLGRDGLLWVLLRRAHRDWQPPANASGPAFEGAQAARRIRTVNLNEAFEGVLEVLDPRDGRLVASREVAGGVLGFPSQDLLYEVRHDTLGQVRMHLWRLGLTPR
jgi:hypothetical protein